ncbi:MAG: adenylyltransferase/cytidyltransferase family protein [Spirochaetales bacterium]|nr:adenylyltransferase/cytidyltransferase family protein [Spirochaetales bacterium]
MIKQYNYGLIIGKFMPLHSGHLSLIEYGLQYCERIKILLVISKNEPIEPELRYSWLIEHYKNNREIDIDITNRDAINELPQENRTEAWCKFIKQEYPCIDCIVSSETYGDTLANFLNVDHLKFDHKREMTPISASEIRKDIDKHIHYLPEHVKKSLTDRK